jgi:DNA repair protein RecN (Recombination protein N)
MLTELRITNFALIDKLHLCFQSGYQVLTGETGAGKSLLIDALSLLAGARPTVDLIRTDAEEAIVEASFSLPSTHPLLSQLREQDFLHPEENDLIIKRVLSRSGRNRLHVNGNLCTVQIVQEIGRQLIDIHSQHDQQSLFSGVAQLKVLDEFAKLIEIQRTYCQHYETWHALLTQREETLHQIVTKREKEEFLRFQFSELEKSDLQTGEVEALTIEHRRLQHAERLGELSQGVFEALHIRDPSLLDELQRIHHHLGELASLDNRVEAWSTLCEQAIVTLQEVADGVRDYREEIEYDPARLAQINDRLATLQRLERKYDCHSDELLHRLLQLKLELEAMDSSQESFDALTNQIEKEEKYVIQYARELSKARQRAAKSLEKKVKKELRDLGMKQIQFQVQMESEISPSEFSASGCDRINFLLSANEGEPLLPLNRVASGGELSRIMLAIKTVLAEVDLIPVLIFDEIDTGVGGTVASVMGERLLELSQFHQVFCITHLPQIASLAHDHYRIEKVVVGKRTISEVKKLDSDARLEEIARMLGGANVTEAVRRTAGEMIQRAQ